MRKSQHLAAELWEYPGYLTQQVVAIGPAEIVYVRETRLTTSPRNLTSDTGAPSSVDHKRINVYYGKSGTVASHCASSVQGADQPCHAGHGARAMSFRTKPRELLN